MGGQYQLQDTGEYVELGGGNLSTYGSVWSAVMIIQTINHSLGFVNKFILNTFKKDTHFNIFKNEMSTHLIKMTKFLGYY